MHARLSRFTDMESEALAASFDWFESEGLPRLKRAASFCTIFFGVDLPAGKASAITCWKSAEALRISAGAEGPLREEALRRAGSSESRGLVDTYEVVFTDSRSGRPDDGTLQARLVRWEGLQPGALRDAQDYFVECELPAWTEDPGYRGILLAANRSLGNTLALSLWAGDDLGTVLERERETTSRITSRRSGPIRPVMFDTYQVAIAPELEPAAALRMSA